jgi:hypothetical protein
MQHDDVGLILGEGYQTPAAAESVPKDAVDLDGERVQLGVKYRTQGLFPFHVMQHIAL